MIALLHFYKWFEKNGEVKFLIKSWLCITATILLVTLSYKPRNSFMKKTITLFVTNISFVLYRTKSPIPYSWKYDAKTYSVYINVWYLNYIVGLWKIN